MSSLDNDDTISWADTVSNGMRGNAIDASQVGVDDPGLTVEQHLSQSPSSPSVADAMARAGSSIDGALSLLWDLDINRLTPSVDYVLNPQSRTGGTSHDAARTPLILEISDSVWERPTFASFKRLLDNYDAETGVPEVISCDERVEEDRFLEAICDTPCMQFAQLWLAEYASDGGASSMDEFKETLRDLWFQLYNRDALRDSSGFEHVFCGEIDDGNVKGLHNFVQVYVEEQRKNFDYMGYLDIYGEPSQEAPPARQQMLIIRFDWLGHTKSVSSMFVGTSPEFEFALYSMLWLVRQRDAVVTLGPYTAKIKVYEMQGKVGSAFPELLEVDVEKVHSATHVPATAVYNYTASPTLGYDNNSSQYEHSFPELGTE